MKRQFSRHRFLVVLVSLDSGRRCGSRAGSARNSEICTEPAEEEPGKRRRRQKKKKKTEENAYAYGQQNWTAGHTTGKKDKPMNQCGGEKREEKREKREKIETRMRRERRERR